VAFTVFTSEVLRDIDLGMEGQFQVALEGGSAWGFTLQGGVDFRSPLRVGKVSLKIYPTIPVVILHVLLMK